MTTVATTSPGAPPTRARPQARAGRILRHAPVNIALTVVALVWLVPTIGLLVTSFRPTQDYFASGWWRALLHPATLTVTNYRHVLRTGGIKDALFTTALITVPSTLLVVIVASLAGYALVFLRWRGRDAV
ncbi:MAG TPA: carbohydrate ABC transporter permease, partial [Acidimicrobiales bacterium]|nr:carbohydrate ABC transporter permease [Acidimicrobiales bacterium]